jgi:hypothetical protein
MIPENCYEWILISEQAILLILFTFYNYNYIKKRIKLDGFTKAIFIFINLSILIKVTLKCVCLIYFS